MGIQRRMGKKSKVVYSRVMRLSHPEKFTKKSEPEYLNLFFGDYGKSQSQQNQ